MNTRSKEADGRYNLSQHAVRILYQLQCERASARVDISEACELSATTVTSVTGSLLEQGLIVEAETAEEVRGRGRPRVLLSLAPSALTFIGVKVCLSSIELAIVDFAGKPVATLSRKVHTGRHRTTEVVEQLVSSIEEILEQSRMQIDDIAGIGIGLSGFVNNASGVVHWSPVLKERDVELRALLSARVDCCVSLDNDANLATLAERWYGLGVGEDNFIVLTMDHGVSLGAFVNGALLRGARGSAGEFGHITVIPDGALCACGKRGCLEAYVADYALAREGLTLNSSYMPDGSLTVAEEVQTLTNRARAGDAPCKQIFSRAGSVLGIGIANLINIFNPKKIILNEIKSGHFDLLKDSVVESIDRNVVRPEKGLNKLHVNVWGDQLWTQGAAALALQEWFNRAGASA